MAAAPDWRWRSCRTCEDARRRCPGRAAADRKDRKPLGRSLALSARDTHGPGTANEMSRYRLLAGGLGFEPRLTESESAVLPLDDPPTMPLKARHNQQWFCNLRFWFCKS